MKSEVEFMQSHEMLLALEAKIIELNKRRKVLERKCDHRIQSLEVIEQARRVSINGICDNLSKDMVASQERNKTLLHEIINITNETIETSFIGEKRHELGYNMSKSRLYSAKSEYIKKIGTLLPLWRQKQMDELENEMKHIKLEKDAVNIRRMRLAIEAEREDRVKDLLENERKELLLSLAKEQSEIVDSNNKDVKRREIADRFDRLIISEMNAATAAPTVLAPTIVAAPPKIKFETAPPAHKPPKIIAVSNTDMAVNDGALSEVAVREDGLNVSVDVAIDPPVHLSLKEAEASVDGETVSPVIISTPSQESGTNNDGILLINTELSLQGADKNDTDMPSSTTSSAKLIRTNSNRSPSSKPTSPSKLPKDIPDIARSIGDENASTSTDIDHVLSSSSFDSPVKNSDNISADVSYVPLIVDNSEEIVAMARSYNLLDCVQIATAVAIKLENYYIICEKNQSVESIPYLKPLDLQGLSIARLQSIINDSLRGTSTNTVDGTNFNYFTAVIQLLLQTKGTELIPCDVFNGLVTVDKMKKELKRLGIGRSELWNAVFNHVSNILKILTKILFRNTNLVQELANRMCECLLHDFVEGDDKIRIRRKLVNLIQLVVLPDVNSSGELSVGGGKPGTAPPTVPPKPTPQKPTKFNKNNYSYDKIGVNISKLSTLVGSSGSQVDLDDDEIFDEEVVAGPPTLRDLAPENGEPVVASAVAKAKEVAIERASKPAPNRTDESDEFEFF